MRGPLNRSSRVSETFQLFFRPLHTSVYCLLGVVTYIHFLAAYICSKVILMAI